MGDSLKQQAHLEDSVLVKIAQKPLLVAAIFLLTAFLPWTLCWIIPAVIKSMQEASVRDLIQWLSLPILFALVNFSIFYLWMNSSVRHHHSSTPRAREVDLRDFKPFEAPEHDEEADFKPFDTPEHHEEADFKLDDRNLDGDFHAQEQDFSVPPNASEYEPFGGGVPQNPRDFDLGDAIFPPKVTDFVRDDLEVVVPPSTTSKKGHHKTRSLTTSGFNPGVSIILPERRPRPHPRRNSSPKPKSKTPGPSVGTGRAGRDFDFCDPTITNEPLGFSRSKTPGPSGRGERTLAFQVDPKVYNNGLKVVDGANVLEGSTDKHVVVARTNSSNSVASPHEKEVRDQQHEYMSKTTSAHNFVYTPPIREPISLDKDDLNARIDTFLTKFKMQRQESNLKALVSS